METDLGRLRTGHFVIIPSFRCNYQCFHCHHSCSPARREAMPLALFQKVVHQALAARWETLCLSGGEPFLFPQYIMVAAERCRNQRRRLVIQTNGFWGADRTKARDFLQPLSDVIEIGFSIDAAHLQQVDLDAVFGALEVSLQAGICRLSVSVAYSDEAELETLRYQLQRRYGGIAVVGWPVLPVGRAKRHPELTAKTPAYAWRSLQHSCGAQTRLSPIVHPSGHFHFCYRIVMALEERDPSNSWRLEEVDLGRNAIARQEPSCYVPSRLRRRWLGLLDTGLPVRGLSSISVTTGCVTSVTKCFRGLK